jgi:hypothetical protein
MEEKIKELERTVELMSKNIEQMVKIQGNLIKTVGRQAKLIEEISKNDYTQSLAIAKIVESLDV